MSTQTLSGTVGWRFVFNSDELEIILPKSTNNTRRHLKTMFMEFILQVQEEAGTQVDLTYSVQTTHQNTYNVNLGVPVGSIELNANNMPALPVFNVEKIIHATANLQSILPTLTETSLFIRHVPYKTLGLIVSDV